MKGRIDRLHEEVIAQNRLAAQSQAEAALDDPTVMFVLETTVGGNDRRIYELSLGRVIARLAEDLARMEAELGELQTEPARRETREPALAGRAPRC